MKKEKTVRTYQRRTKSGKMVTVREHKASYDAAEEARKAATKKAGAGSELSKKRAVKEENPLGFSADDYKEWYHWDMEDDANNEAALRVEKALIKKMGKRAYNKYLEDMSNSYTARGHKKAYQALFDEHTSQQKKQDAKSKVAAKDIVSDAKGDKLPSVGQKVSLKDWMGGKAQSYEVVGVQKATKADKDESGLQNWLWVKDKKGNIHAATQEEDGRIGIDSTWTDFTDTKSHPYASSLKKAGYSLRKKQGVGGEYWDVESDKTDKDIARSAKDSSKSSTKTPSVPENLEKFGGSSLMIGDNATKAVKQLKEAGLKSFKSGVMTYYVHPDGKSVYAYDTEDGELRRRSIDRREFARHDKTIDKIISSYGTPTTSSSRSMTTDYLRDAKKKAKDSDIVEPKTKKLTARDYQSMSDEDLQKHYDNYRYKTNSSLSRSEQYHKKTIAAEVARRSEAKTKAEEKSARKAVGGLVSGSTWKYNSSDGSFSTSDSTAWGRPDSSRVNKLIQKAKDAGWKKADRSSSMQPDDKGYRSTERYVSPDGKHELTYHYSAGDFSRNNHYVTIRRIKSEETPTKQAEPKTKKSKESKVSSKKSPKTSGGAPTSAELRKQADEMDAKAYKETSRAAHKKLIEKGYKKHTWQGHTYYYKGKEGSYSGSYVTLDEKGKPKAAMPSLKERFKEQIARSIGKKYKGRRLR